MEGRCMKCKKQVDIQDIIITKSPKGLSVAKGKCPICNTTVCRLLGKSKQ